MTEDKFLRLGSSDIITNKLDEIIEAFVMFYGEEKREEITNRFRNALILKFCSVKSMKRIIEEIKASLFKEVFGVPDSKDINVDVDDLVKRLVIGDFDGIYISKDVMEIITGDRKMRPDVMFQKYKRGLYPRLEVLVKRYPSLKNKLLPYEKKYKSEKEKQDEIEDKYIKQLVGEFKFLFLTDDLKDTERYGIWMSNIRYYISGKLDMRGHCFDEEHERIINDPKTPEWKKQSIINDRLDFLKVLYPLYRDGKELNDPTYEDYLNDPGCKDFIKDTIVICSKITKRTKELYAQMVVEQVENTEDYKNNRRIINKKNYVNKDDPLSQFVYTSPICCFEENFIKTDNGYVVSPIVLINAEMPDIDIAVIHELNHAFEYSLIDINENGSKGTTGWDYAELEFKSERDNQYDTYKGISRNYELINEYVNDRIAQEITDIMHSRGNYIITPVRIEETSTYLTARILLEDFYREFKDIIIKSRSNNNIRYLFECIGRENFEELNKLVNDFYKKIGIGAKARDKISEYTSHIKSKTADEIGKFVNKKEQILENMRQYYYGKSQVIG